MVIVKIYIAAVRPYTIFFQIGLFNAKWHSIYHNQNALDIAIW